MNKSPKKLIVDSLKFSLNLAVLLAMVLTSFKPIVVKAAEVQNDPNLVYFSQNTAIRPLSSTIASNLEALDIDNLPLQLMPATSHAGKPDKVVNAVITAYTSTPDQTDDSPFIAATGKHVYDGMIAANWLPFGTKIKIPSLYGDKVFTVDDRMNKRYGYGRMDIWFDATKNEARKFGVKRVEVEVYYQDEELAKK